MKKKSDKRKGSNKIARLKYLIAAAALLFVMLPEMLVKSTEVTSRAFITAIGIDRGEDGGYEVAAQLVRPQSSSGEGEEQSIVTAAGKTLKTAIDGISSRTGKEANLAHCKLLFLGRSAMEEGIIRDLSFFSSAPDVDNGLMIAASSDTAKANLEKLSEFEKDSAFSLPDFFSQNRSSDLNAVVTLKTFMEDYYEGAGDLTLPVIDISGAELSDEFRTVVIKDGKPVKTLDRETSKALLWLDKKVSRGAVLLGSGGEAFSKVTLGMKDKSTGMKTFFREGKPVCRIAVRLKLSLDEIDRERSGLSIEEEKKLGQSVAAAVREKVSGEIQELRRQCAEGDFDVMRITEHFYRFNNKQYKAYAAAGGSIIRDCAVEVKVKADIKI